MTFNDIFHRIVWRYVTGMGIVLCGKDSPDPPDYAGAAQATAAGNADAARIAASANRVNQYTPWGNLVFSDLGDDRWRADTVLSPEQQQQLDAQNELQLGLLNTAGSGLQYANNVLSKPGVDLAGLPQLAVNAGQTAQDAIMSRLDPKFAASEDQLRTRLANQGIGQGTDTYNSELNTFNQGKNDAYTQAALQGMGIGNQSRQQAFQEQSYNQMQPINLINALRTGTQVGTPQFQNVAQQATTAGPDLLGAANAQYGANLGASNARNAGIGNFMGGLFSLGSGALSGGYF